MHICIILFACFGWMVPLVQPPSGADTLQTPEPLAIFQNAVAMGVGPAGTMYVSVEGGTVLLKLDLQTYEVVERYGIPGDLGQVSSMAVSESMSIYLADRRLAKIGRYSRGFRLLNEYQTEDATQPFSAIDRFVVDDQRRLFALSRSDGLMALWSGSESPTLVGDMREGEGELLEPVDLALTGQSSVLVADARKGAVLEFDRWGSFSRTLIAGRSDELSHIAVGAESVWLLEGQTLHQFGNGGVLIESYPVDFPGPVVDMVSTSNAVYLLTPAGLFSLTTRANR